jgi:colanic acid biosynthesis glycosyl transferase WcaI
MRVSILYHYFHPDDVVSARLFSDLAKHLVSKGWDVEALPCNRGCRRDGVVHASAEDWAGVKIRRVWRPAFPQGSSLGRALNTVWMLCAWALILRRPFRAKPDVVIVGTDPPCSAAVVSLFSPSLWLPRFVCWVHDLYPDIAAASGMLNEDSRGYRGLSNVMTMAYPKYAAVIDIGPSMKARLKARNLECENETITPWAMYEPPEPPEYDEEMRHKLFGDAKVGVMYSGNFGRAHDASLFVKLAAELKGSGVAFAFAVRGNAVDALQREIESSGADIRVVPFAQEPARHLAAADVHLVSLKKEWSGMVVPSKYFGSLALGRPVIYAGPDESDIADDVDAGPFSDVEQSSVMMSRRLS